MFENDDDFILDDDLLKDIDKKEEEYFSQKLLEESQKNRPAKRRKTDEFSLSNDSDFLSNLTFDDEPNFRTNCAESQDSKDPEHSGLSSPEITTNSKKRNESNLEKHENSVVASRKKMILEIFKTGSKKPSDTKNETKTIKEQSPSPSVKKSAENVESRKASALEILRRGSANRTPDELTNETKSPKSNPSKRSSPFIEKNKINHQLNENPPTVNNVPESFKKPPERTDIESSKKYAREAKNSPKFPARDRPIAAQRMPVVRKFPGPAGLLPDSPDPKLDETKLLNRLNPDLYRSQIDTCDNKDKSNLSEYFSQNTERMFSVGAWRTMLDDLPPDFLKGHEIATIKREARNNSYESSKIPYLAGVIERIDHSAENPWLVLKDLTDSIEGTMHTDIPLAYPDVLEPGVVVLLRNVGLIGFQEVQKRARTFHVMISSPNVLAIYSDKTRLVTTSHMNDVLSGTYRIETSRTLKSSSTCDVTESLSIGSEINPTKTGTFRDPFATGNVTGKSFEADNFVIDEDDSPFDCLNIEPTNDSQLLKSFSNPPPFNVKKKSPVGKEKTKVNKTDSLNNSKIEVKPLKITGLKSRLMQFRSKDVLTPSIREEKPEDVPSLPTDKINSTADSKKSMNCSSENTHFGDNLFNSENDTDDEIMSQLDIDSIVTNYNNSNT